MIHSNKLLLNICNYMEGSAKLTLSQNNLNLYTSMSYAINDKLILYPYICFWRGAPLFEIVFASKLANSHVEKVWE